ncbi:VOC family protein [Candidatus Nitrososphaera evergladensis]|nr:VOC family protein [Candidatus Nitrososphaera evergladensis]
MVEEWHLPLAGVLAYLAQTKRNSNSCNKRLGAKRNSLERQETEEGDDDDSMRVYRISAITLKVDKMESSCQFYSKIPGFRIVYGGAPSDAFSTFEVGEGERKAYLNLELAERAGRKTVKLDNNKHHHHYTVVDQQQSLDHDENLEKAMKTTTGTEREKERGGKQGSRSDFGRIILHTENVDDLYEHMRKDEFLSNHAIFETEPVDAPWGERFFHIREPNGYQLSFAQPLRR